MSKGIDRMTCAECKKFRSKQIIQNYYENKEECQKSYQQGRADGIDEIIPKAFEWLMQMDIIDCDQCDYKSECLNRNMNCWEVMAEHCIEQLKEQTE